MNFFSHKYNGVGDCSDGYDEGSCSAQIVLVYLNMRIQHSKCEYILQISVMEKMTVLQVKMNAYVIYPEYILVHAIVQCMSSVV